MNRQEALSVLNELAQRHTEIVAYAGLVVIDKLDKTDQIQLKIKYIPNGHDKKVIEEFLKERNLKMKEEKGFLIIYQ